MKYRNLLIIAGVLLFLVLSAFFLAFFTIAIPPQQEYAFIYIEKGDNIDTVTKQAEEKGITTSSGILRSIMLWYGDERTIKTGYYAFYSGQNIFRVAWRLMHGSYGYVPIKVTIPEGANYRKLTEIFAGKFPNLPSTEAETIFKQNEGYIFPDTYFFPPQAWADIIIERTREEFDSVYKNLIAKLDDSKHVQGDVIVLNKMRYSGDIIKMASIIEREGDSLVNKKLISGILWRRIDIGMALQVDASLQYITGRGSADLTVSDLKLKDLYNSYTNKGLPPGPIANPGKDSLDAAMNPTENEYLYFLTGDNGTTYFSKTYAEHMKLRGKYIK